MKQNSFFKVWDQFSLGHLTTESFHPQSKNLSSLVNENLHAAIECLQNIDTRAFEIVENNYLQMVDDMARQMKNCKGRVFLCGCGATGRLALSLETIFKKQDSSVEIISFMAGGDYALIKSVENFEDKMSYGSRQLEELGFSDKDLLIAITEGGETSFVIGAALHASKVSQYMSLFLYCNPQSQLEKIERCRHVLEDKKIKTYSFNVGAMAISGSTRMQASTVLMLVLGCALQANEQSILASQLVTDYLNALKRIDYQKLAPFIVKEAQWVSQHGILTYLCDHDISIALLTDTTERAPTFNMLAFEDVDEKNNFSASYIAIRDTSDTQSAWQMCLARCPRTLQWADIIEITGLESLYRFDISEKAITRRSERAKHLLFDISIQGQKLDFKLEELSCHFELSLEDLLFKHLALKLLLNTHSTLVMAKLGRIHDNVMVWVKPSNLKLIDRAIRYSHLLLTNQGHLLDIQKVAKTLLSLVESIREDESIVLKTVEIIKNELNNT